MEDIIILQWKIGDRSFFPPEVDNRLLQIANTHFGMGCTVFEKYKCIKVKKIVNENIYPFNKLLNKLALLWGEAQLKLPFVRLKKKIKKI